MKTARWLLIAVVPLFCYSCVGDAPRDNPLDPHNKQNQSAQIQGQVLTLYPPRQPLPQASVTLLPPGRIARTNLEGEFAFPDLTPGDYLLQVQRDGFAADSQQVSVNSILTVNFFLDALPRVDSVRLTTHHVSRWYPPEDLYQYRIVLHAADQDGAQDLIAAGYQIGNGLFTDTLATRDLPDPRRKTFQMVRSLSELPVSSLHLLIGKPFHFWVVDQAGQQESAGPFYLTRIIETIPVVLSPAGLATVNQFPVEMTWEPVTVPFPFHLRLEVHQITMGLPGLIARFEPIEPTATRYSFAGPLSPGDYLWVLFIVDEFGNTSRSREGTFRVQ